MTTVLVLAGGPDREHAVSMASGRAIAAALAAHGGFDCRLREIGRLTPGELAGMPGDVLWPALHGRWGEGGPLQDLLEADGRAYVGCRPAAARAAMDKVHSKALASAAGLEVAATAIVDPEDAGLPLPLPLVVKPVFEGSTIGLRICRTSAQWHEARAMMQEAAERGVVYMAEPLAQGRELTLGLLERGGGLAALPLVEIKAASGLYDYQAKYERDDTAYLVNPELPSGLAERLQRQTLALAKTMGLRHLARADFILSDDGRAWFLEVNTMPGFTSHSLLPMAAQAAGLEMPALCALLVKCAAGAGA